MSTFTYRGIDLQMCHVTHYERRMKFDGPQFLWAEHQISVRGVYSPETTCYRVEGGDANNVVKDLGRNPAFTDQAIRDMLTQPRGKLVFTGAGPDANGAPNLFLDGLQHDSLVIVESPPPGKQGLVGEAGFLLDCNNGPRILRHNVQRILGTRLWDVELTALVCLNEAYKYYSSPAVLLSHQWTAIEDIDRDGWSTRTIRGHAIFRTDRLTQMQAKVDDFREALGHPIPDNCQRMGIQVVAHEDGNRVDYRFVDTFKSHRIIPPNITHIAAVARLHQSQPGSVNQALGAISIIGGGLGTIGGGLRGLGREVAGMLPTRSHVFSIQVWGNEKATRYDLVKTALAILRAKKPPAASIVHPQESLTLTVDLMGRYAALDVSYEVGIPVTFANVINNPLGFFNPSDPSLFAIDEDNLAKQIPELMELEIQDVATAKNRPGRGAVPDKLTRGSWLGALVAQGLGSPNQNPGPPPLAPPAVDTDLPDPE